MLDRVATLVASGIAPPRAWEVVLARDEPLAGAVLHGAPGSVQRGVGVHPVVRALAAADPVWADVAAVLEVAARTGAPAAPALRSLAAAVRETAAATRAITVALAAPRASARVVLAMPAVGLLLGSTWGSGAVWTLVATPFGWACSVLACGFVAAGVAWSRRLVRAAEPDRHVVGAPLEAWAVAVGGGGAWSTARSAVADAWDHRSVPVADADRIDETLELAVSVGVPAAGLLRAAAEETRRDAAASGLAAAERLGVRLVLPLGLCVLPAFVLVGVVPVVVGVLSSTVGVFD